MAKKLPLVAIIGRTNIGKSTLFNALTGRRLAVVDDSLGVTRDRHYAVVRRAGYTFQLIDTGGVVGGPDGNPMNEAVRVQAELAIAESDLIVCLLDGLHGVHPQDPEVVQQLRRSEKPVIWVVNKCEKPETQQAAAEFYALGIDDLICVSAAHRGNLHALLERIAADLKIEREAEQTEEQEERAEIEAAELEAELSDEEQQALLDQDDEDAIPQFTGPIKVAIIGKPNVGKSSIVNRILGQNRVVTSDVAGTTTDSINITLTRDGQEYMIVDTAGLRKKKKVEDVSVERYSNLRTLRSLASCDVVLLVLDAKDGAPSEQDAKIAGLIHERGKGLVIVVNKWDAVEKDHRTVKGYKDMIQEVFKFSKYAPIVFVSALSGRRCPSVLPVAREVYLGSRKRIKTSELNRILSRAFAHRPPPVYRGEPVRLFFATQIAVAPPSFVLFLNHPKRIDVTYQRYLKNLIRKEYAFEGTDIRLHLRKRTSKGERDLELERGEQRE